LALEIRFQFRALNTSASWRILGHRKNNENRVGSGQSLNLIVLGEEERYQSLSKVGGTRGNGGFFSFISEFHPTFTP
jgi:hypothetical protein